jgi:hypothetical protein
MIKSRRMRWTGHVAFMGDIRNKRRRRRRCEDNMKIDLKEIVWIAISKAPDDDHIGRNM